MTCMLNSPPNSLFGVKSDTITSPHPASDSDAVSNIKPLLRGVSLHINCGGRGAKKGPKKPVRDRSRVEVSRIDRLLRMRAEACVTAQDDAALDLSC